jgi:hypothetical protein
VAGQPLAGLALHGEERLLRLLLPQQSMRHYSKFSLQAGHRPELWADASVRTGLVVVEAAWVEALGC